MKIYIVGAQEKREYHNECFHEETLKLNVTFFQTKKNASHIKGHVSLQIRVTEIYFSSFSTKTYVFGARKNRLTETVLMSTKNICLNEHVRK